MATHYGINEKYMMRSIQVKEGLISPHLENKFIFLIFFDKSNWLIFMNFALSIR